MLKRTLLAACAAFTLVVALAEPALADGLFPGLPIEGGASYCASFSVTGAQCSVTVPAGNAVPTGTEYIPADLYGLSQTTNSQGLPQTQGIAAAAFGFGNTVVSTTAGAATIPNGTVNYVINVSETAASAITMPATPLPGQILRIAQVVANGASGSTTLTANAGQTLVPSSVTVSAATAATSVTMLWNASTSTWTRIQ
jgi:hypothetical protein